MFVWWLGCIILFVLIMAIGITIGIQSNDSEFGGDIIGSLITLSLIIIIICMVQSFFSSYQTNEQYVYENKKSVYSLEDNIGIHGSYVGSFILGVGQVNSDLYYYVMSGDDKEGYTVKKFDASDIYLVPEDVAIPYYIEKHKTYELVAARNIIFGGLFKPLSTQTVNNIEKKELHLPKGYIKQNYNIDMK